MDDHRCLTLRLQRMPELPEPPAGATKRPG
jgi:hypothetical protein